MSDILLPITLFLIFYTADWYKTQKGILPDASNEGNPITRYLYRKVSRWLFHGAHIFYGIAMIILIWLGGKLGIWIGYSAAVYNFVGYLSWTRLNRWKEKTNRLGWTPILLIMALLMGYLSVLLHKFIWP